MKSEVIAKLKLEDGTSVTIRKTTTNGVTSYSHYIKGRYAFGLLKPASKEMLQGLYDNGYFNPLFTEEV